MLSWIVGFALLSGFSFAQDFSELPDLPPSPCFEGCTNKMDSIQRRFFDAGVAPSQEPAVYSGECVYLSEMYNPDHVHHAVTLLDHYQGHLYFSAIFSFFAEKNEYADWDLETARRLMSEDWKNYGLIKWASDSGRVAIFNDDLAPVYIYWMRQDPRDQSLLLIYYAGGTYLKGFCDLKMHPR